MNIIDVLNPEEYGTITPYVWSQFKRLLKEGYMPVFGIGARPRPFRSEYFNFYKSCCKNKIINLKNYENIKNKFQNKFIEIKLIFILSNSKHGRFLSTDVDNLAKSVLDAINDTITNDKFIRRLILEKYKSIDYDNKKLRELESQCIIGIKIFDE